MQIKVGQRRGVVVPYVILMSLFISLTVPRIELSLFPKMDIWHIAVTAMVLLNSKKVAQVFARNQHLLLFLIFIILHALLNMYFVDNAAEVVIIIRRVALMLVSYSIFPLMLSYYYRPEDMRPSMDRFLVFAITLSTVFGFYELIARKYGLPLGDLVQQHFRSLAGGYMMTDFFGSQMTGIFREPRFFSFFLVVCLYILLFLRRLKYHFLLISFVLIDVLFTMSITGYLSALFVLMLYFLGRGGGSRSKLSQPRKRAIVGIGVILLIIGIGYSSNTYQRVEDRLIGPFVQNLGANLKRMLQAPVSHTKVIHMPGYSAYISTFGEVSFILKTLREHPLTGYGIGYSKKKLQRTMGLNAFAEVMVRWGLIGLILFIFIAALEGKYFPYTRTSVLFLFYLVFCSSDGSVADVLFWFLFSLVFLYNRLNYRFDRYNIVEYIRSGHAGIGYAFPLNESQNNG